MLIVLVAAVALVSAAAQTRAQAGFAQGASSARAAACPIAGQCAVDAKTGCPLGGPASGAHPASPAPVKPTGSQRCVLVPSTLFYVSGRTTTGCTEVLFIQLKLQPGITQYESVVYSLVGEGTRWWADPSTPLDQTGAATHAGQTYKTGVMTYTVPQGYLAWDVAGGSGGPTSCTDKVPPPGLTEGFAAWGVKGSATSTGGGGTGKSDGADGADGAVIHVHGPRHIAYQHSFDQVITGTTGRSGDYVESGEQLGWARCATTLAAEQARSGFTPWPSGTGAVHGRFRLIARFYARNKLRHAICAYLIKESTRQTYAHAANYWSNS
jgi:hypothetical protein